VLLFIFNLPPLEFRHVRALFRGVSCAVSLRVVLRIRYVQEPEPAVAGGVTSPSTPPQRSSIQAEWRQSEFERNSNNWYQSR